MDFDFKDPRAKGNKTPWPLAQARSCFMLICWCSVCLEPVFGNLFRKKYANGTVVMQNNAKGFQTNQIIM